MKTKTRSVAILSVSAFLASALSSEPASASIPTPPPSDIEFCGPESIPSSVEAQEHFDRPVVFESDTCSGTPDNVERNTAIRTFTEDGDPADLVEIHTVTQAWWGGPISYNDYYVNGQFAFSTDTLHNSFSSSYMWEQIVQDNEERALTILGAISSGHARLFKDSIENPYSGCNNMYSAYGGPDQATEQLKCGAIGVGSCATLNPFVCAAGGGLALLCMWAVNKACENGGC